MFPVFYYTPEPEPEPAPEREEKAPARAPDHAPFWWDMPKIDPKQAWAATKALCGG